MIDDRIVVRKGVNPIRSFVKRQGRITEGQQRALKQCWPGYGLELQAGELDLRNVFQREAPTVLEIGFGDGQSLLTMAQQNPDKNYIGIEVHRPGVGRLMMGIESAQLSNVRAYCADAIDVMQRCIPPDSLAAVQLFFPDPWHKKRHHKRRIVNERFIETVANKLCPDGVLHMATDWENYAEQMLALMSDRQDFVNVAGPGQYHPRPAYRPLTKFEQRGHRLGHGVWDLLFRKLT